MKQQKRVPHLLKEHTRAAEGAVKAQLEGRVLALE